MNDAILIIGNGFDLHCGLKSSYKDFFNDSRKNNEKYVLYFKDSNHQAFWKHIGRVSSTSIMSDSFMTLWDLLFILKSENQVFNNWCDIELVISDSFKLEDEKCFWDHVYENLSDYSRIDFYILTSEATYIDRIAYFANRVYGNVLFQKNKNTNQIEKITKSEFIQFIFEQLKLFEKRFAQYIYSLAVDQKYKEKVIESLNIIFGKGEGVNEHNSYINRSIISFNYTDNKIKAIESTLCSRYDNVHGISDESGLNIIIGIDDLQLQNNKIKYLQESSIFSKSFRKISALVETSNLEVTILKEDIKNIVFYGHSLNPADYSYFQSIFDFYDLYHSKVKLWFAYSKHDSFKEDDFDISIRSLLVKYGGTFDNSYHGKNLFHKLLLENRIKKIEI